MTYTHEPPKQQSSYETLEKIAEDFNDKVAVGILRERLEVQAARLRMVEKQFEGRIEEQRLVNATLFNYISEMRATIPHMERLSDRLLIQEKRLDGLYEINTAILTQLKELEDSSESKEEPLFCLPSQGLPQGPLAVPLSGENVTHVTKGSQI